MRKKRVYNSEARQAQAVETRGRILTSAKELFEVEGFEGVTIDRIAQEAEVSPSSVYSLFQSKRGVLRALMDEAFPPDQYAALVEGAMREKSARHRLVITAQIVRQMYDAERAQMALFRGVSALAPEFKELEKEREKRRYERQGESAKMMAEEKSLKKGLSLPEARDILWAFTGRDMYRMFVIERGWTSKKYEKWLAELLIETLIGPPLP